MSKRRIGDVAREVGTTARTIRYYEEIGLLGSDGEREAGKHREYSDRDVERLRELMRLRRLLGISLDELKELTEAEEARLLLREEWLQDDPADERRLELLGQSIELVERQLELVRARVSEIEKLEASLRQRRTLLRERREQVVASLGEQERLAS